MNENRLKYLLDQFTGKKATYAELEEMAAYYKDERYAPFIFSFMEETFEKVPIHALSYEVDWESVYSSIVSKQATNDVKDKGKVRRITRVLVAASIALVLGLSTYLYLERDKTVVPGQNAIVNKDIPAPQATRAMITLSDGRKVSLESVTSGTLAQDAGVVVAKNEKGEVIYQGKGAAMAYNTLENPKASKVVSMTLADGTRVWLDAASSITYPTVFVGKERVVEIAGQAYFEVVHDKSKPFKVRKKDSDESVQVLGTHFNVMAFDDEPTVAVTLLEGSVRVAKANASEVIRPGEQAQIDKTASIRVVEADLEFTMAWKNGFFSFKSVAIPDLMQELSRWYDIEVAYVGEIPKERITGEIERDANLSRVLKMLEFAGVKFRLEGKKIIVSK